MKAGSLGLSLTVAAAGLALASPARAGELVTWETKSAYVDPAKEPMDSGPDDTPAEPGLRVNVYLPDGYATSPCRPVLYLTHGGFGNYEYWAHPTKLDILNVAKGFPGIIVMPESGALGGGIDYWNGGKRGDPGWASYHLRELIPLAESRLRICPGRRNHAIGGYSVGGLTAVLHAAARPGYFGSVASFSGVLAPKRPEFWSAFSAGAAALWPDYFATEPMYRKIFGDPVAQAFYWDGHDPLTLAANLRHTRVFFSHGDGVPRGPSDLDHPVKPLEGEVIVMADDFERAAKEAGVSYTRFRHQGVHDYPYFKLAAAKALGWGFFGDANEQPGSWTYKTVARRGTMWDLEFEFSEPPETLQVFQRQGRRLEASGSGTVTISTREGCRFTTSLPFKRDLSAACERGGDQRAGGRRARIRLSVRPRAVPAGRRVRFRFKAVVRSPARRPVRGARIRFAGWRARTNRRGRARITVRLNRLGRYRARAIKRGLRRGRATVRVRPA